MAERDDPEIIESYVRCARVLDVLWEHMANGLSPSEVASAAREPKSYISRALQSLRAAGHAEQIHDTGRWRPSVRLARRAADVQRALDRAAARLDELRERVATPTND